MFSRMSVLWLVLGMSGGYAVAGRSVTAQEGRIVSPPVLNPGNTIRLTFEHGTYSTTTDSVNCTVADVQGRWIRCKASDPIDEARQEKWYSLDRVIQVTRQER